MHAETDITFWDRIARRYARTPISNQAAYEATLARVKSHLSTADRVLELGAGTGSTALILAPFVAEYTATDAAPGMVEIAEEKRRVAGIDGLRVYRAGIAADQHGGAPFDVVTAFNLFHLVPDLDAALAEVARMVRPGGRFISKTPCLRDSLGLRLMSRTVIPIMRLLGKAPRVITFTIPELQAAMARAGFEIIETGLYPAATRSHFVVAVRR